MRVSLLLSALLGGGTWLLFAVGAVAQAPEPLVDPGASPITEVQPGVFNIGKLQLQQAQRTVTFPATVNMDKGLLEYLIVTKDGPTHESLFVTEVPPADLHLAMLLLGLKGDAKGQGNEPPGQINQEYLRHAPELAGDQITLTATYKDKAGAEKTVPVEDWVFNTEINKVAPRGPWIYTGSFIGLAGKFVAQTDGVFAAMVTNPAALINNPRPGHKSDQVWIVHEKAVPPADTPVVLTVHLLPAEAAKPQTKDK